MTDCRSELCVCVSVLSVCLLSFIVSVQSHCWGEWKFRFDNVDSWAQSGRRDRARQPYTLRFKVVIFFMVMSLYIRNRLWYFELCCDRFARIIQQHQQRLQKQKEFDKNACLLPAQILVSKFFYFIIKWFKIFFIYTKFYIEKIGLCNS